MLVVVDFNFNSVNAVVYVRKMIPEFIGKEKWTEHFESPTSIKRKESDAFASCYNPSFTPSHCDKIKLIKQNVTAFKL